MQTLYIDVYFLINFTIDLLALYFAALFSKIKSTALRLVVCSFFAAAFACFVVLSSVKGLIFITLIVLVAFLITLIFTGNSSCLRKVKFFISFLLFETLIGGIVNGIYNLLDEYFYPLLEESNYTDSNRKFLSLSLLVLISYGILKLLFLIFFGVKKEENVEIEIGVLGNVIKITALVDSGNLLIDPMSGEPVILIKKEALIFLKKYGDILKTEDSEIKKRLRIIPAMGIGGRKILTGIRCDYIIFNKEKNRHNNIVIAIDDEGGSFGGYDALIPVSMTDGLS